jgi:O-antigen/teichoic acid export membrane protein
MTDPTSAPGVPLPDTAGGVLDVPEALPGEETGGGRVPAGQSLRHLAARGTLVNTGFTVAFSALGLLKGFILAGFLSRGDYGLWGIVVVSLGTLVWLKQAGIGDKYIQQDEDDQEAAFQKAFTLELVFTAILVAVILVAIPVFVVLYDTPELIAPSIVVAASLLVSVFQAPLWIYYRRMNFVHQRVLQGVDPVVGFIVSVGLAVMGAGYWAFVGGLVAGVTAASLASVLNSPVRLRLRYDPGTMRSYARFSWPLFLAGGSSVLMVQVAVVVANGHLGLAAIGVITLAATITAFTDKVDELVTGTLYPAVCAVKDNVALLYESFVKSNRLALMWAVPFGVGLTLFCADLVHFGLGSRWDPAIGVLQIYGLAAALNHVGFNWTAYFRARDETRPIAIANLAALIAFVLVGVPLILSLGLTGFAIGVAVQGLVHLAFRAYYMQRMFHGFGFVRHAARAFGPTLPAAAVVLALRAVEPGGRTLELALGELAIYLAVTAAATWYLESSLLREAAEYLFGPRPAKAAV